jgi:hypothetical protein
MNKELLNKAEKIFTEFSADELRTITEPISVEESEYTTEVELIEEEELESSDGKKSIVKSHVRFRLHAKIKRRCYAIYSKYKYKAWVERVDDGSSFKVDKLKMVMNSGNGEFSKSNRNKSKISKTDEVYSGNACKSASLVATAKKGNSSATVIVKLR